MTRPSKRQRPSRLVRLIALLLVSAAGCLSLRRRCPVRPDPDRRRHRDAEASPRVKADDVVYDLGSGDGRIVIAAARDFGARGVGIEIDPGLVAYSRELAQKAGVGDRVTFRSDDLLETNLSDATVVTLYLSYSMNLRLRPKLLQRAAARCAHRLARFRHGCGLAAESDDSGHVARSHVERVPLGGPAALVSPR